MRYKVSIIGLILAVLLLPLLAQAQHTTVSAQVLDPIGQIYRTCSGSANFVGQNPTPGAGPYLLGGSVFQTVVPIACDGAGRFLVSISDNNMITPTPSQWSFAICSGFGVYTGPPICFTTLITITGATQDITATLQAVSAPLPPYSPLLETNGVPNNVQTMLDLIAGTNITLTYNGAGGVIISSTGGGGGGGLPPFGIGSKAVTTNLSSSTPGDCAIWATGNVLSDAPCQNANQVSVQTFGAVGDGQVATDCSINNGSGVVNCSTNHFVPGDVGKSVSMWDAGPSVVKAPSTYIVPLTTTIASYGSPTQVTLTATAGNSATPSSHFAWGTNNYTAIVNARESGNAQFPNGYVLFFPAGYYLTPTIDIPCGAIGNFPASPAGGGPFTCATAAKNITIAGASQLSTTIENFVYDRGWIGAGSGACGSYFYTCAIIMFGAASTSDGAHSDAAHWVNGVSIHDLTLVDTKFGNGNFFNEPGAISLNNTSHSEVYNVTMQESSYACIYSGNEPVYVHDNSAYRCGWGGPAYSGTNSAFNTVVPNSRIVNNRVLYSAQCIEAGAPYQQIIGNYCQQDDGASNYPSGAGITVSPIRCLSLSSLTFGEWGWTVKGNQCVNWHTAAGGGEALDAFNTTVFSGVVIENNTFINSGAIVLGDGGDGPLTGWPSGEVPPVAHSTSFFRNNTIRYDKNFQGQTQGLGINLSAKAEKWVLSNNSMILPGAGSNCGSCVGLTLLNDIPAWQPSTVYTKDASNPSRVQSPMPNGFWYSPTGTSGTCTSGSTAPVFPTTIGNTVADGTCTLQNVGAKPIQVVSDFVIGYPGGSSNGNFTIQNQGMLPSSIAFTNVTNSGNVFSGSAQISYTANSWALTGFPLESWFQGDDAPTSTTHAAYLRATSPYSSSLRFSLSSNAFPVADFYRPADVVNLITPSAGGGSRVYTSGGWKPKTWVASTSYAYNSMVGASPDNLHVFLVTDSAGCTSGTPQPAWSTGAGAITNDTSGGGTCHWKESGASAQFTSSGGVTTAGLTTNTIPKAASSSALADSSSTDDGTTLNLGTGLVANSAIGLGVSGGLGGAGTSTLFIGYGASGVTNIEKNSSAVWRFDSNGDFVTPNHQNIGDAVSRWITSLFVGSSIVYQNSNAKVFWISGTTPNGSQTADQGSLIFNRNGGAHQTAWFKVTGTGNTGWESAVTESATGDASILGNMTAVSYTSSGSNGGVTGTEGTGASVPAGAGLDVLWPDSTAHRFKMNNNNETTNENVAGTLPSGNVTTAGTAVNTGTCQAQTGITITGALTTDNVVANIGAALPATWQTGIVLSVHVTAGNTVTVYLCNPTAGNITPAATQVNVRILR